MADESKASKPKPPQGGKAPQGGKPAPGGKPRSGKGGAAAAPAAAPVATRARVTGDVPPRLRDRLVNIALPRVRDFKGVAPKAFDGRGNYALGLKEQVIFPEIVYDRVDKVRGMDVVMVTSARTDEEAKALLTHLGVPFRES